MRHKNEVLDVEGAKAGNKQKQPYRAAVTSTTNQTMKITYGLSEGEIAGFSPTGVFSEADMLKRIYLDGTPIMGEDGVRLLDVKVEFRSGTQDQDVIAGLPSVTVENSVNVEVRMASPVSRSFTRTETTSYDVRISVPQLWEGDAEGNSYKGNIKFKIEISENNGPFVTAGEYVINEKIINGWSQTYNVPVTRGVSHTVRISRMTPETTSEFSANKLIVDSIVEVTDVKLRYPRTALLYLEYNAEQFSNVPKLEVRCFGKADILIPANYNPQTRQYATTGVGTSNGVWNGTFKRAFTDNPVWVWLDLVTSKRYGTGNRISLDMVDKWELYGLSKYCDELVPDGKGGQEPRFTCNNLYLQKAEDAFKVFKDLTAMFRSKTVWDGSKIRPVADVPRTPSLSFTSANCKNVVYSSIASESQHNLINVQYYDKDNNFASKIAMRRDAKNIVARDRVVEMNFTALGCTSEGQAQRIAQYILTSELNELNVVSFTTGLEGSIPRLNDVFYFADEFIAGRVIGGRIVSVNGTKVTVDRELPLSAGPVTDPNVQIVLNRDDGTTAPISITNVSQDKRTVTLKTAAPAATGPELQWAILTPQVMPQLFYITDLEYNARDNTYNIVGLQYLKSKYAAIDGDARIVEPPISVIEHAMLKAPATLLATYDVKIVQDISVCNVHVSWAQTLNAVSYRLEMRKDNGEWRIVGSFTALTAELENMYTGVYEFRIAAYDTFNNASQYTYSQPLSVQGKILPPPQLSVYGVTGILLGFQHNWVYPAHTEDSRAVRIRKAMADPAQYPDQTIEEFDVAYPANTFVQNNMPSNTSAWFSAAIVDKYGVVGPYTDWRKATVNSDPDQIMDLIEGNIALKDLDEELRKDLTDTKELASTANQNAESAKVAADAAKAAADNAQSTANTAKTAADNAAAQAGQNATAISNEAAARIAADKVESDARIAAVQSLQDGISTETQQRKDADGSLATLITTNKTSTDASISLIQTQVSTNTNDISTNAQSITTLSNRLTLNENATGDAQRLAADASTKASTALDLGNANAQNITTLRSDLSTGKGKNAIIAPFSDPQSMSADVALSSVTANLVTSSQRVKGKMYDITFTHQAGAIYFGTTTAAYAASRAAGSVRGGKKYLLSFFAKQMDTSKLTAFGVTVCWYRRDANGNVLTTTVSGIAQGNTGTRIIPTSAGSVVTCKGLTAPADAFGFSFWLTGDGVYQVAGARIQIDLLMLEEGIGDDKPASMWVAGSPDLGAIQTTLDANSSAITMLNTQVGTLNGTTTSQGQAITSLQGSVNTINNTLASKADTSALNTLSQKVTVNEGNIATHTQQLTNLSNSITTLQGDISKKADAGALTTLEGRVSVNEGAISSQSGQLTNLSNSITTLNGQMANKAESSAVTNLESRVATNENNITSLSGQTTALTNRVGNVKAYSIVTFKNGSGAGLTKNRGIYSGNGVHMHWIYRGLNLIVYTVAGDIASVSNYDTYANVGTATQDLYAAINALTDGTYFSIIGNDNIGGVNDLGPADALRSLLLTCGASDQYYKQWSWLNIPLFTGRKHIDAGNGILDIFTSSVQDQWIEYPLTIINGVPQGMSGQRAIATIQDAQATAISTLNNSVSIHDNQLTSLSGAVTTLQNSVVNINDSLSRKADAQAVTNLENRVQTNENGISSLSNATTQLRNSLSSATISIQMTGGTPRDQWETPTPWMDYKIVDQAGTRTGKVIQLGDNNGVDTAWLHAANFLTFDDTKTYRLRARFRRVAGDGTVFVGVSQKNADKSKYIRQDGSESNDMTSSNYLFAGKPPLGEWQEIWWYIRGRSGGAATGDGGSLSNPRTAAHPTAYITPIFIANYNSVSGIVELDDLILEDISASVQADANAAAITSISAQVTQNAGDITSLSGSVTNLQNSITTINGQLANKADSSAITNLQSQINTTNDAVNSVSNQTTALKNQVGNTTSYTFVTFKNGFAVGMPKSGGMYNSRNQLVGYFYRGLNLVVFGATADVVSITPFDTYADVYGQCNALYAAVSALNSGTYFAIVGNDNIQAVGELNPDTAFRNLLLSCGASSAYLASWNWTSLPLFIGRKDAGVNNGILGMFDSDQGNQWIEYPITFVNNTPIGFGGDRQTAVQYNAQAQAISTMQNSVTQHGLDISTLSRATTDLSGSVTYLNGQVTKIDGYTSLNDTRNNNFQPNYYYDNHARRIVREFKLASVLGLSGIMPDIYVTLETQVPWSDPSGGQIIQIARGSDTKLTAERRSADYISWFGWAQDIKALNDGLLHKAEAQAVTDLSGRVDIVDGKAQAAADATTLLRTDVDGHTNALQLHAQSINGIEAKYTVKIDNNGYISGYGLISTMNNGVPTSAFTVNADFFSVGKVGDSTSYKPFVVVTSSNQVIDGVTYPEIGVYMRQAFMSKLSVTSAHIQDLAVTNAKIANLAVTAAKIADLAVDTLKIKDNAVTVPVGVAGADRVQPAPNGGTGNWGPTNADFENQLHEWEARFGDLTSLTINRSGGKVKIEASCTFQQQQETALAGWGAGGQLLPQADRRRFRAVLSVYRGTTLVARTMAPPTYVAGGSDYGTVFDATYTISAGLDVDTSTGNQTYTLKFGFGFVGGSVSEGRISHQFYPLYLSNIRLTVTELKK